MGDRVEADHWTDDARLVEEDAIRLVIESRTLLAAEEALTELDAYFMGMSIEEVEVALAGIHEYERAVRAERSIVMGWERLVE